MRALLDLMRENEATLPVHHLVSTFGELLESARKQLTILDPEVGEEELIQAVAAALAKMRMP